MENINSFAEWAKVMSERNVVINYVIYRKPGAYTPYEQSEKFSDESLFEDTHFTSAVIRDVIPLGNGDFLLGMLQVGDAEYTSEIPVFGDDNYNIEYVRLSEIRMHIIGSEQFLRD